MTETYGRSKRPRPPFHITLFNGRSRLLRRKTHWWALMGANGERLSVSETLGRHHRNEIASRVSEESGFPISNPEDC